MKAMYRLIMLSAEHCASRSSVHLVVEYFRAYPSSAQAHISAGHGLGIELFGEIDPETLRVV